MAYDKEFYLKLAREAGVPEDQLQAITQAVSNEVFAKALSDRVLAKDEFSRQMDALTKEKSGYQQWYQQALKTFEDNQKTVSQVQAQLAAYRDAYGDAPANSNGSGNQQQQVQNPATGEWMSRKDFEAELAKRETGYLGVMTTMVACANDYQSKFGAPLNPDELVKYATERGLPLNAAYESFINPKLLEKQQKDWEAKVQQARDDGAREALSKHRLPVDSKPAEPHLLFDRPKPEEVPANDIERTRAFADFYNSPEMAEAARK